MVKILAIGDFHGKFPGKLKEIIKKENIELVVSIGDYMPFSFRKFWFKHCYGKDVELWEIIGKKKYKKLILDDLKKGEVVLKELNNLGVPVISVVGNLDYPGYLDTQDEKVRGAKKRNWNWDEQDFFSKILKKYKHIKRFDYDFVKFRGLVFIGGFGHSNPGDIKSKAYKKYSQKLKILFTRFKKENKKKKLIFVFHNMPYKAGKLDLITDKTAHKLARKRHYGSIITRKIIYKYKPVLGIGGHMHENQGKCKIGRTTVLNTGAAKDKRAVILDFNSKIGRVERLRFVR